MSSDLQQPMVTWFDPWNYPSRVTDAIAVQVAEAIYRGADFRTAVMAVGVSPTRARQWLLWGEEAYSRDADGNDRHSDYLNFFLKVMQAIGLAAGPAQQASRLEAPGWWLSHNPETRNGWGAANAASGQVAIEDSTPQVEASTALTTLPTPSPEDTRTILRTLVEAGGSLVESDPPSDSGSDISGDSHSLAG